MILKRKKKIRLIHKKNIDTVSPKFWEETGMKFDNDKRYFHGYVTKKNIPSALIGTGFYVEENMIDSNEINDFLNQTHTISVKEHFDYKFAFSFAGEDRDIIQKIVDKLNEYDISVFYDQNYQAELHGKELSNYFKETYGRKTEYVVIFLSKYYAQKDWPNFEFEVAKDEAQKRGKEFILPVRLDDTIIQGINRNIGIIDYREKGTDGTVKVLLEKIGIDMQS